MAPNTPRSESRKLKDPRARSSTSLGMHANVPVNDMTAISETGRQADGVMSDEKDAPPARPKRGNSIEDQQTMRATRKSRIYYRRFMRNKAAVAGLVIFLSLIHI